MEDFQVIGEKLLYLGVCSSLPVEEVKARAKAYPCGTSGGWQLSEEDFGPTAKNGNPCPDAPKTHKHYLFEC